VKLYVQVPARWNESVEAPACGHMLKVELTPGAKAPTEPQPKMTVCPIATLGALKIAAQVTGDDAACIAATSASMAATRVKSCAAVGCSGIPESANANAGIESIAMMSEIPTFLMRKL
jgi:hypothetical protein